jgi:antitoxin (DNA-binding transcriptional repressor) of toxin-antitoxin stability system
MMYTLNKDQPMETISVKDARRQFARLIGDVQRGRCVALTRRGKTVAKIAPLGRPERPRLPDLTAFRASLGKPPRKSKATIRTLRDQERY